jgi:hypothetical protein
MSIVLTDLDQLLLDRWNDTVGIWEAIKELEDRLADSLKSAAERVGPWLRERGFEVSDVSTRTATIDFRRPEWMGKRDESYIHAYIAEVFPYGYRKVREDRAHIWIYAGNLSEDQQEVFEAETRQRLGNHPDEWINPDCDAEYPVGRYLQAYDDKGRLQLASSSEALESFLKEQVEQVLGILDPLNDSLKEALSASRPKSR